MGISKFFVSRPIFAWVIAISIMLAGIGAIMSLSVAQYPDVAPPSVTVTATYPGASAETLDSSVTQIIEQQLIGIDNLLYFSSTSNNSGQATVNVTFAKGTDPDIAQVQVQNKVNQGLSRLPEAVQEQGLTVQKGNTDFLMIVAVYDKSDRSTSSDVADYLVSNMQDDIGRINGVGNETVFGSQYAMRIWLDPVKLAARQLMPSDISTAVTAQNVDLSSGQIGASPAVKGQVLNAVVLSKSRLQTPEQFRNIVVKTLTDGSVVHLGDVARVEMGQESYNFSAELNGHPAAGIALQLAPGADALKTTEAVKAEVARLSSHMPAGYAVDYPRDSSEFVKLSIREVVETLIIAVILVVVVMYLFLQSWRATLVPAVAVPVVLLGTFGILALFGYSINTLTLFGMVLAIGLLVDDAIVVVENVERIMHEEGLSPVDATIKSMDEIGSALVGIAVVLSAVLLPMAFFGGSTGVIYRQFSVTIVSAMALSVVVALILSPALCATLLQPSHHDPLTRPGIFGNFNRWLDRWTSRYIDTTRGVIARRGLHLLVYVGLAVVVVVLFERLPTGFLPNEDQGEVMVQYTLPPGASEERTDKVRQQITKYFTTQEKDNARLSMVVLGFSFSGQGLNTGMGFLALAPFEDRSGKANSADAITKRAAKAFGAIRDATVFPLTPPAISGLGQSDGFTFQLLNTNNLSDKAFLEARNKLLAAAQKDPKLMQVRLSALPDAPEMKVTFDDAKLAVLGLTSSDATSVLSSAWGSTYIDDFVDRGRVKRVYMQSDAPYRMQPEDLAKWYVRASSTTDTVSSGATTNSISSMTPFSSFTNISWSKGANTMTRFNGHAAYEIDGSAASGYSSGEAMQEMIRLQQQVAPDTTYAWSGLSYQENQASGQAIYLYALSVLVVFLALAALYESWSVPLAVLMVIPLGVIGAVLAVTLRGLENNIYFQVGLLTTIGLAAKNAILIVEFAEASRLAGRDPLDAALEAARVRLRPILMTSIAFIAGVFPLAVATGAGAESRIAIGTAVLGGMITATALAIFYVPMFFIVIGRLFERRAAKKEVA